MPAGGYFGVYRGSGSVETVIQLTVMEVTAMEENTPKTTHFPTGKGEFWLLPGMILIGVLLMDLLFYYGCNLGFAVAAVTGILVSAVYVLRKAPRVTPYSVALVVCAIIAAASLLRSDDAMVKFVTVILALLSCNLGLCLAAGKNRRSPAGVTSLLDAPMALFTLGFGQMHNAWGGFRDALTEAGPAGKNRTAVFLGLLAAIPVVAVLIPLLMRADAAFEGMLNLLPEFDFVELIVALIFGVPLGIVLYTRNTALKHAEKAEDSHWVPRQCNPLTVSTVLIAICVVYLAYLVSQLAYFVGGFSGILPQGFTVAEYARRGFFEMAWLSIINLVIITAAVALCEKKNGRAPLMTRLLCLFVGLVTLFFAAASSAKMLHYIGTYGMTRLRLLTQVIIIFIALAVIYVLVWLFRPKFAYMKAVLLTAMLMASAVAWADVDTVAAAYNVGAYQSGKLESIDVQHLSSLGDGAVPYIEELTDDPNRDIRAAAIDELHDRAQVRNDDIRAWNIASAIAEEILENYR